MKFIPNNKIIVEYNDYRILIGEGATELISYIGVVVRDNVSILYDDWWCASLNIKENLWDFLFISKILFIWFF